MNFTVVGLSHRTAPLDVRERVSVTGGELPEALEEASRLLGQVVILSTCNRTEVYTAGHRNVERAVLGFLAHRAGMAPEELRPYLFTLTDEECYRHLFLVSAGLDSLVLGETEVLGQVRHAFSSATSVKACGFPLSRLFHQALRVGRRVRRETGISRNALSVSRACVQVARRALGDLEGKRVLVVGAGEAGRLSAQALRDAGVWQMVVVSRTFPHALELAQRLGAQAEPFDRLPERLAWADAVVSCTGASTAILTREVVASALARRNGRPLFIADIAVPRDVEASVRELPGVHVVDVDALEDVAEVNRRLRAREAERARAIVEEEVSAFARWTLTLQAIPSLAEMRRRAEELRRLELDRLFRRLHNLTEEERTRIEAMSRALVKRILHDPTVFLRQNPAPETVRAFRLLFGLDERDGDAP